MGDSLPPPAEFDLVGSYARRRGADVEVVLAKPEGQLDETPIVVRLAKGRTHVDAAAELTHDGSATRLTVRTPRVGLSNGTWSMTMHLGADTVAPLAARLLVQGERPVVLLWGSKGNPSLVPGRKVVVTPKQQAAHKAGLVLDKALSALPDDSAKKIRRGARKTARRVLG